MTTAELRELDAEVHQKVMGFTDLRRLPVYRDPECGEPHVADVEWLTPGENGETVFGTAIDWCYLPKYEHDSTGDEFCEMVPAYTADIAAADSVLAHLWATGKYIEIKTQRHVAHGTGELVAMCVIKCKKWDRDRGYFCCILPDGQMPLAICRAALAAVTPPVTHPAKAER